MTKKKTVEKVGNLPGAANKNILHSLALPVKKIKQLITWNN